MDEVEKLPHPPRDTLEEVDQLISRLMRPTFVLNMAKSGEHLESAWGKGCRTRAAKARAEIDAIVHQYIRENPHETA